MEQALDQSEKMFHNVFSYGLRPHLFTSTLIGWGLACSVILDNTLKMGQAALKQLHVENRCITTSHLFACMYYTHERFQEIYMK